MPLPPEPKRDNPNTYVVEDRSGDDELNRLLVLDELMNKTVRSALEEQIDPVELERVLDVGCGTGGWLIEMAKTYPHIQTLVGVDASERLIDFARAQAQKEHVDDRVTFQVADALRMLEFPHRYFDMVNHRLGISWVRTWEWQKLLMEYKRVTRSNGLIRITESDWAGATPGAIVNRWQELLVKAGALAGNLFTEELDGVTKHLAEHVTPFGLLQLQSRQYRIQDYRSDTPEGRAFLVGGVLLIKNTEPFIRKWLRAPDDFSDLCRQAIEEMNDPNYVATTRLAMVWGRNP